MLSLACDMLANKNPPTIEVQSLGRNRGFIRLSASRAPIFVPSPGEKVPLSKYKGSWDLVPTEIRVQKESNWVVFTIPAKFAFSQYKKIEEETAKAVAAKQKEEHKFFTAERKSTLCWWGIMTGLVAVGVAAAVWIWIDDARIRREGQYVLDHQQELLWGPIKRGK